MPLHDFLPGREAELVIWVGTFRALITATPEAYGLTPAQAAAYDDLATNFCNAYNLANAEATRSPSAIVAKDDARALLVASTRSLARLIQATPGITNPQRTNLGLTVRDGQLTPVPPPASAPGLGILWAAGNTVRLRLHDPSGPSRRGKPAGVRGAALFSHVGTEPPTEHAQWKFEGNIGRTVAQVSFPVGTMPGAKVWFTAWWFNERKQPGPAAHPVGTHIPGGTAMAA